jgi:agmatinase
MMVRMDNFPAFLESESEEPEGKHKSDSLFHIIPVPLEQTVSYGGGTAGGPAAILEASQQLERWDGFSEPITAGIDTGPFIDCSGDISVILGRIEKAVSAVAERDKIPVVLGGEHTVSLAPIRVLASRYSEPIGIVQVDAHADLRDSYEGSPFSHACVIRRAL